MHSFITSAEEAMLLKVCIFSQHNSKICKQILMKYSRNVDEQIIKVW